jgi:adenosylcobinamide hydrolase
MRYCIRDNTLLLRGRFRAASTGLGGGLGEVTTVLNHTVGDEFDQGNPVRYLDLLVARHGLSLEYFGLLTAVPMRYLCVLQYDFVTIFVTAGVSNPNPPLSPHTINIIAYSREGLSDAALLETIITATEAKAQALHDLGYDFSGTTTDAVAVATECSSASTHTYAGTLTEVGRRVYAAVMHGVQQALKRYEGEIQRERPSFFIFSRYGGEHWVEWQQEDCPYYPCHFAGQCCDFCYCPFYPCEDEELGEWVESSSGGNIWGCARCTLLHIPEVAEYVKRNPEASLSELKRLLGRL